VLPQVEATVGIVRRAGDHGRSLCAQGS